MTTNEPIRIATLGDSEDTGSYVDSGDIIIPVRLIQDPTTVPVRRGANPEYMDAGTMTYMSRAHAAEHAALALAALIAYDTPIDPRREAVRALVDAIDGVGASEDDITAIIEAATRDTKQ